MAAFHQERIDNALEELELFNTEALPVEPDPLPVQAAACVAVYDGLITLCDTALNAIGHGLEEIRITCLDWRTSVAGIRDARAQQAAADEYRQFMANATNIVNLFPIPSYFSAFAGEGCAIPNNLIKL